MSQEILSSSGCTIKGRGESATQKNVLIGESPRRELRILVTPTNVVVMVHHGSQEMFAVNRGSYHKWNPLDLRVHPDAWSIFALNTTQS